MRLDPRVERTVAQADGAVLVWVRLIAGIAQRTEQPSTWRSAHGRRTEALTHPRSRRLELTDWCILGRRRPLAALLAVPFAITYAVLPKARPTVGCLTEPTRGVSVGSHASPGPTSIVFSRFFFLLRSTPWGGSYCSS